MWDEWSSYFDDAAGASNGSWDYIPQEMPSNGSWDFIPEDYSTGNGSWDYIPEDYPSNGGWDIPGGFPADSPGDGDIYAPQTGPGTGAPGPTSGKELDYYELVRKFGPAVAGQMMKAKMPRRPGSVMGGVGTVLGALGMLGLMNAKPGAPAAARPGGVAAGSQTPLGRNVWQGTGQPVSKYKIPGYANGGLAAFSNYMRKK